jgi:hypothetical protein
MFHGQIQTFRPAPLAPLRRVALAPRTLTLGPEDQELRIDVDGGGDLAAIEIRSRLAHSPADRGALGITSDATTNSAPLRIVLPRTLWCNLPCAREALRIALHLEAVVRDGTVKIDATARRLFPADGAGSWVE